MINRYVDMRADAGIGKVKVGVQSMEDIEEVSKSTTCWAWDMFGKVKADSCRYGERCAWLC